MLKKGTTLEWKDKILRDGVDIDPSIGGKGGKFELKLGDKIVRKNGEIVVAELPRKRPFKIEIGQIVERHMMDNDVVLFNRQPSLHSNSMLSKKVIVRPGKTLRFNLATTKGFNAVCFLFIYLLLLLGF